MSFFAQDAIVSDHSSDRTVAEGVRLARRSVLRMSAGSIAAALAFASCAATGAPTRTTAGTRSTALGQASDGTLEIGELLLELQPRASHIIQAQGSQEEAYLMAVGELLARLRVPTVPELQGAMRAHLEAQGADWSQGLEFVVTMFELEPGGGFTHHDHRDYNGVILGVDGEVRIRNFDIVGDELVPPAGETFQIRQTRDDLILPGRFSTLGRTRENVHDLVAGPDGGTVIDAFTFFVPGARSYFMDVDPVARDAERGIFDAAWAS